MNKPKLDIDMDGKTAYGQGWSSGRNCSYFFKAQFDNGFILAFYSHSPWGRIHNQERGWVIIDPKKKIIVDELSTYSWGNQSANFKGWMIKNKNKFGKLKYFTEESWDGRTKHIWVMEE